MSVHTENILTNSQETGILVLPLPPWKSHLTFLGFLSCWWRTGVGENYLDLSYNIPPYLKCYDSTKNFSSDPKVQHSKKDKISFVLTEHN